MTFKEVKNNWVKIVLVLITTGFIGQVVDVWDLSIKRDDNYIQKYVDCNKEVSQLNSDIAQINTRLGLLEMASMEIPFPYWIKDKKGYIVWVNQAYVKTVLDPLGISVEEFLNTRGEALGDDFVKIILEHDRLVMLYDKLMKFPESVPDLEEGTSYKYPLHSRFGKTEGTVGIWIPNKFKG